MRRGMSDEHRVEVSGHGAVALGWLRERVFRVSRGQTLAYVTDAADHAANRARIEHLAAGADHLFIEAAFLHRDRALAEATGEQARLRPHGRPARSPGRPAWAGSRRFTSRAATWLIRKLFRESCGRRSGGPQDAMTREGPPQLVRSWIAATALGEPGSALPRRAAGARSCGRGRPG